MVKNYVLSFEKAYLLEIRIFLLRTALSLRLRAFALNSSQKGLKPIISLTSFSVLEADALAFSAPIFTDFER